MYRKVEESCGITYAFILSSALTIDLKFFHYKCRVLTAEAEGVGNGT